MNERDELDDYIKSRDKKDPGFAGLVEAAQRRRAFAKRLAAERKRRRMSQTLVAARMGTSASMVHRVENGLDVRVSSIERYAAALGGVLNMKLKRA